jgi:hypothetical protein
MAGGGAVPALAVAIGANTAAVMAAAATAVPSAVRRNTRFELIGELQGRRRTSVPGVLGTVARPA